jgi:NitT/TauT family transport system ATP-binding protein
MAAPEHHISISALTHVFDDGREPLTALSAVDLAVPRGQFLSIIGPSGCGKSTLLRLIGGLLSATHGTALVSGIAAVDARKNRDAGFVFQDPSLMPWRSVEANVRLPIELDGFAKTRALPGTDELLDIVGLAQFRHYYPHQLSGGMQQRVAIARALAFNPSLLLMDEPLGALDELTRSGMRYELLRIWGQASANADGRKTVVFVTHSIAEAISLSDRVVVMSARPGRIKADIDIELPRPRTEEMERTAPFLDYAEQLRTLLKEDQ